MKWILLLGLFLTHPALAGVDLVKVDKSENRMYLLQGGQVLRTYHVALGAHPQGHKQREGDERTPEGRYVLDYKKEDSSFHRAMHISYPNEADKLSARQRGESPGGFIMVHGQPAKLGWLSLLTQRFNWTDGCIALSNEEMDEIMALVDVGTVIEIEW